MSELFDDNNENKNEDNLLHNDENNDFSMSLDDRKEQLEDKITREMSGKMPPKNDTAAKWNSFDNAAADEFTSPYDRTPTVRLNKNQTQNTALPKLNENPQRKGSSFNNPYYNPSPYANTRVVDYTGGAPLYSQKPPKENMSKGLKSYLIIITGITIIFLIAFIFECVKTYNQNGIFGGENGIFNDIDKYLDTDYDIFDFDEGDSDGENSDSDGAFDFIDKDDSDGEKADKLKDAPDEKTVVNKSAANIKAADQPDDIDSAEYTAKKAFKKVENSVVNVVVYEGEVGNEDYADGSGSGIIISDNGYIVTNSHVINDSKDYSVEIITTSGDSYMAAIVGFDTRTDLAVLKIDDTGLTPAEFVDSNQIEVGQDAIAVGNPGGMAYSNSLTRGCVSALNRTVSSNKLVPYIQTDAAINPGNSGGPLLNSAGQVMGITTIKIANADYEGMGFAIPSNTVISIANDLIGQGFVANRVRIGIVGTQTTSDFLSNKPSGIIINEFSKDSPFNGTQAKVGDIITAINGNKVESFTELYSELDNYKPNDTVSITLYRGATSTSKDKTFDVKIKLIADNGETQQ